MIKFHIPWFVDLRSAMVDGKLVTAKDRVIDLPAESRNLDLKWTRNSTPALSYQKGVEHYVDRYWKIQHGETISGFDSRWIFPK